MRRNAVDGVLDPAARASHWTRWLGSVTIPSSHVERAMDICEWLRGLDLGQYEANFRDNKISAALLTRLTNDDLKDIGISALGDRLPAARRNRRFG